MMTNVQKIGKVIEKEYNSDALTIAIQVNNIYMSFVTYMSIK